MAEFIGHILAVDGAPGEVHDAPRNDIGVRIRDKAGVEYIYLKGVANTAPGDFVVYTPGPFTTARLTDAHVGPVAIATAPVVANTYGFYIIDGAVPAAAVATHTDGRAALYASDTAGRATATPADGTLILGAVATDDAANNAGPVIVHYPFVTGDSGHGGD